MEAKIEKTLNIILKDNEIEHPKNVVKKCVDENKKIGFNKNIFNVDEIKLIKDIKK